MNPNDLTDPLTHGPADHPPTEEVEQLPDDWLQQTTQPPPVPGQHVVQRALPLGGRYGLAPIDPRWPNAFFSQQNPMPISLLPAGNFEEKLTCLQERLQLQPQQRVLDVHCASGMYARTLAEQGFWVLGVDPSSFLLRQAKNQSLTMKSPPHFLQEDLRNFFFSEKFEAAYCLDNRFGFFDDVGNAQILANVHRSLRSRGCLVLQLPNRDFFLDELPRKQWWGDSRLAIHEYAYLEEHASRICIQQEIFSATGPQTSQQYSFRLYSAHELHALLSSIGFEILEISGTFFAKHAFFGVDSPELVVVAQKRPS